MRAQRLVLPPAQPDGGLKPAMVADPAAASLSLILQIERDARRAATVRELMHLMANETRRAVGARQVFVLSATAASHKAEAVSSLSTVERHSPTVSWIEKQVSQLLAAAPKTTPPGPIRARLDGGALSGTTAEIYPFPEAAAQAVAAPGGHRLGAVLVVRETAFSDAETMLLQRLCETYGHAWESLERPRRSWVRSVRPARAGMLAAALVAALGFVPIPLTALAPVEIAPRNPEVVTAPIDGAIESIDVDPNQPVRAGDALFRYQDTQLRGALDVAAREVAVAEARLRQVTQLAFIDPTAKRDMAVARSELRLKRTEHAFAADMHERSIVRATRDGVAVFADKRELIGRPVSTGQRVMDIADPGQTLFRLNVLADDALVLKDGARVRVFMDSDPLNPLNARLVRAAPMPRLSEAGILGFRADAVLEADGTMPPLGHRGTAQIVGERVSLAFFLFRRPLAAIRQRFGL